MSIDGRDYVGTIGMGRITVKNSAGKNYAVTNPAQFLKHLVEAHGSGDSSTHVENGNLFYVTQWFFNDVKEQVDKLNNSFS
jgi:hypothetical protein|tara:strand:+ start:664 stop:906 length:243 start_codon:yes stop_codon:yes gene_type:complete